MARQEWQVADQRWQDLRSQKRTAFSKPATTGRKNESMDKPISELDYKELFCTLTGEYGVVKQAYVQKVFRNFEALHGEYGELTDMV